jgi:hypothetical protein
MTRFLRGLGAVVCTAALVSSAGAVVPDPVNSITPGCIRVDPGGELTLDGQVIGTDAAPLGGNDVRVIFNAGCSALIQNPPGDCSQPTVLTQTTPGSGIFSFAPAIGGCCALPSSVTIEADPGAVTLLPVYDSVGSNDNNGSGQSNLADFVVFQGAFLSANTCNDVKGGPDDGPGGNCDEFVSLPDFVVFQSLFLNGAECP